MTALVEKCRKRLAELHHKVGMLAASSERRGLKHAEDTDDLSLAHRRLLEAYDALTAVVARGTQ